MFAVRKTRERISQALDPRRNIYYHLDKQRRELATPTSLEEQRPDVYSIPCVFIARFGKVLAFRASGRLYLSKGIHLCPCRRRYHLLPNNSEV